MSDPAQPPSGDPARSRHIAGPGDHTGRLASFHGFRRLATVWNDPSNTDLKTRRVNPHTLAPGDVLTVPAPEPKRVDKGHNQFHQFVVSANALLLNLTLENFERQPLKNRFYRLTVGERDLTGPGVVPSVPRTDKTNAKGELTQAIGPNDAFGELVVHEGDTAESPIAVKFRLLIGLLPPANTTRGAQIRLNNLGYFAGFKEEDTTQLTWAVEEFEHDQGMKPTGRFDDPKVVNKIAHVHGDLLAAEKVP